MRSHSLSRLLVSLAIAGLTAVPAHAATIDLGNDASFSIGAGLRASYSSVENGAPSGADRSNDFNVDSTRVYMGGRVMKEFGATLNLERDSTDGLSIMDAYVQYEPMPGFNVWIGRMLPASDRSNLDGPYYLNAWDYPGTVSMYPQYAVGRDTGVQVWGKLMNDKLVYVTGFFNGHNRYTGGSNQSDNLLWAGRLAYAIWDAEPAPAYYTGSTYYGSKDILTVAIAGMQQSDGVGNSSAAKGDYSAWNVDFLMEKNLSAAGTVTLEGAYYKYDTDDMPDCGTAEPGSLACTSTANNVGGLVQGKAWLAGAAFLFPQKVGYGQFQPFARYQTFDRDLSNTTVKTWDAGVHYVIKGPNARISAFWSNTKDDQPVPSTSTDKFVIGLQFQI